MVFAGVPVCIMMVSAEILYHFEPNISDFAFACIFWTIVMFVAIIGMIGYSIIPKPFVLPLGIIGWLIFFGVLFWKFWFGSQVLGHQHSDPHWHSIIIKEGSRF